MAPPAAQPPIVRLAGATLRYGSRVLWQDLSLDVAPGEFLAVLGPNGAGKTSLLRVLLGVTTVTDGRVEILGRAPERGSEQIAYVPQQRAFDADLPIRGRDLVRLGLDGHRWGVSARRGVEEAVEDVIRAVGASGFADVPIGLLSGGEQQRLRIAQALLGNPRLLLCDEPLLSLDLASAQSVSALIDRRRRTFDTAVVFVTHEINPILPLVDRVLYLVGGRWAVGTAQEVLTSRRLTELFGTPVDVLHVRGRIVVVGTGEEVEPAGHHLVPQPGDRRTR